jgi:hypothetical protein
MAIRHGNKYFTPVLLDGGIKKSPIGDLNQTEYITSLRQLMPQRRH